ncbi:TetR/AcrR family transcriptional regulator [Methylobacterium sp. A54F]
MTSPAETRRTALRTLLVDAAERAIAAEGLAALRARDLARAAGCAVGAIYIAFPDLDALAYAVNLRTLALFEAALARDEPAPARHPAEAGTELVRLGLAYLDFARAEPLRWRALFQHRAAGGAAPPAAYVAEQARLFRRIEAPLRLLRPDLPPDALSLLARSLFSATHGIVSLGLDERLMALPPEVVRGQVETLVRAMAAGLAKT